MGEKRHSRDIRHSARREGRAADCNHGRGLPGKGSGHCLGNLYYSMDSQKNKDEINRFPTSGFNNDLYEKSTADAVLFVFSLAL